MSGVEPQDTITESSVKQRAERKTVHAVGLNGLLTSVRMVITVTHRWNALILFSPSGHGSFSATEVVRCLFKVRPPHPGLTTAPPPPCLSCQPGTCADESRSKRTHTDDDDDDDDKGQGISAGAQETAAEGRPNRGENSAEVQ